MLRPTLAAAASFAAVSLLAAIVLVIGQGGFGFGDVPAFMLWTVPLAAIHLPVLALFSRVAGSWDWLPAFLAAATLGVLTGVGFTLVAAFVLGPWFSGFSFSPFVSWLAGGIAAFLVVVAMPRREHRRTAALIGIAFFAVAIVGVPRVASLLVALAQPGIR